MAAAAVLAQAGAAPARAPRLGAGKILVAARNLPDPNFAQTVILLVQHDRTSAMGLALNRQTKIRVSHLLPEFEKAKGRPETVYAGGPVGRTGVLALLRAPEKPADARHVFADVYMVSSKALLEKTIAAGAGADTLRLYLGYCGWSAGQLESEVEAGVWEILPGDAAWVFDRDPASLWLRLIERTELRIAWRGR